LTSMSSQTPVNGVGYDQSLLADAPEVTKADKQEGYNPDLLEQGKPASRPSPRPGTVPPGGKYQTNDSSPIRIATAATFPTTTKQRSKKLWFIVAGVILILVAIGVGVGVTEADKHHNSNAENTDNSNGTASSTNSGSKPPPTTNATTTTDGGKSNGGSGSGGAGVTDGVVSIIAPSGS